MFQRGEHYRGSTTDYEDMSVKRHAPRWIKALTKFGFIAPCAGLKALRPSSDGLLGQGEVCPGMRFFHAKTLHLIADNYATHKHPAVQAWLAKHPGFHMHFTPASASWLNRVERFFRDICENRLRRGVFTSVPELVAAIDEYIAHHNPKPFIWTKSARDILHKVIRANGRLSSKKNATLH
jgi:transposase